MNGPFRPRYILPQELSAYGLPDPSAVPNIMTLVDRASALIDEHCGRTDGNGNGSLVYSTYIERLLLQASGRNILRVSFKPLVPISSDTLTTIQLSGSVKPNTFDTFATVNSIVRPDNTLSPIIGISGRYGYARRGQSMIYPDLNYGMNLLQVASFFGGPPGWTPIDATGVDWDRDSGELWIPAGIYMSQYTEIIVCYNSGYNPLQMPNPIKQATAMLVGNFLARPASGVKGVSIPGAMNVTLTDDLIDTTIDNMLMRFKNVIAY